MVERMNTLQVAQKPARKPQPVGRSLVAAPAPAPARSPGRMVWAAYVLGIAATVALGVGVAAAAGQLWGAAVCAALVFSVSTLAAVLLTRSVMAANRRAGTRVGLLS